MGEEELVLDDYPHHRSEGIASAWLRDAAADLTLDPLTLAVVRDDHLKVSNSDAEDSYVTRLIRVSLGMGERATRRFWLMQSWRLLLDRFPCGDILVDRAPLSEVTAITYVDVDGETQTISTSKYEVENASVETNRYARVRLAYNETWPATRCQRRAVTVSCVLGYPTTGSPALADLPDDLVHGRLLVIGELYRQREESIQAVISTPATVRARELWQAYRVY